MASITLKKIPAPLHRALKSRARLHKRSLTQEAIAVLEQVVTPTRKIDVEKMLAEEEKFRSKIKFIAYPKDIDRFKRAGRE